MLHFTRKLDIHPLPHVSFYKCPELEFVCVLGVGIIGDGAVFVRVAFTKFFKKFGRRFSDNCLILNVSGDLGC